MEEQDLREIGITDPGHRRKIVSAARSLPKVCVASEIIRCMLRWSIITHDFISIIL